MAIKPHCVVCGFMSDPVGSVRFANYSAGWIEPDFVGWSNELGVTAPPGVGLFCRRHLRRARWLRHLESEQAVRWLAAPSIPLWRWLRHN